jgi:hypothetical protein
MPQRSDCPICAKRKPERFCPAKGEKICAVCCGTEREVTLDCPTDCSYLIAAHRYEQEHRKPLAESELPFPDVELSRDLLYDRQALISGLSHTIAVFSRQHRELTDPDALAAATTLAETYRTLLSGIYYEKPPTAPLAAALYAALAQFIQDYKKQEASSAGFPATKDKDIFQALVFLARVCRSRTNERPRARIFVALLRDQYPATEEKPEPSRIITP